MRTILLLWCFWQPSAFGFSVKLLRNRANAGKSTALFGTNIRHQNCQSRPDVVVVGKIIVDEYGDPALPDAPTITVGGGGPQAAIGCCLALAAWSLMIDENRFSSNGNIINSSNEFPPKQPVTLLAPVGDLDFSKDEESSLLQILEPSLTNIRLIRGANLKTPRIRLWHDDNQIQNWYAIDDTFEEPGAAGLWKSVPSIEDYLEAFASYSSTSTSKPVLHVIHECGSQAPGNNGDSLPLMNQDLRNRISMLGLEPILFPRENGIVSEQDALHAANLIQQILDATPSNDQKVICQPDIPAYEAMKSFLPTSPNIDSWTIRNGPQGSHLIDGQSALAKHIPTATLRQLVNPTGAGNAYSAAFTALRGSGCAATSSACIAAGVGAVFCEYPHCPPYSWRTIQRVAEASKQVLDNMRARGKEDTIDLSM